MIRIIASADIQHSLPVTVSRAKSLAVQDGIKEITVLTPTHRDNDLLLSYWGNEDLNGMRKGRQYDGYSVRISSMSRYDDQDRGESSVLVLIRPSMSYLDVADEFEKVRYLAVIPAPDDSIAPWIRRWRPFDIQNTELIPEALHLTPLSPLLRTALDELVWSSKSTGYSLSLEDEMRCKTYARALFKFEPDLIPNHIEDYLLHGKHWKPAYARYFSELVRKLIKGSHFKGGAISGLALLYGSWLEATSKEAGSEQ